MSAVRAIVAVARVETWRLLRSPTSVTLLLLVPAMQILLFGTAIRPNASTIHVALAGPPAARIVAAAIAREPGLMLTGTILPPGEARAAVRAGRAEMGVELPLKSGPAQPIRVVIDSANPALTAAAEPRIRAAYWRKVADDGGLADLAPPLLVDHLYNADGRSDWGFLPALIGTIMMISMIMLGTLSIARERELGTWETLLSLPLGPGTLLLGKIAPYIIVGTLQGLVVLQLGIGLFGLPARGSIVALALLMPLFSAAHLVLGHALAARAESQLAALQGAIAFYLPAMLLSGFLYPFEALPPWARVIGEIFPLTHFIRAAREATLRGGGAGAVLAHGVPISGFLLIALIFARLQQRPRLID